jgi:5-methylcytosine-specific restriction endonuclease McrA
MQYVLVVDADRRPLMPCRPARARRLLTQHQAAVLRQFPFTIILNTPRPAAMVVPMRLKIDPGSQTTGLILMRERTSTPRNPTTSSEIRLTPTIDITTESSSGDVTDASADSEIGHIMWAAELSHRGQEVHASLEKRRAARRGRRQRHTRCRPQRGDNRLRTPGWLPPSLESRVQNVVTWAQRLSRSCPIDSISFEAVRFDTQLLQNPEIEGMEYQHGTLAGTEVRKYVLLKWNYRCAYCHQVATATNRWEIDHIVPRRRGGSNRASNLALSCHDCNQAKGDQTADEWGHPNVQAEAKLPLRDAAAVNSTRRTLEQRLKALGLPMETGSGGITTWNRTQRGLPKTHCLDAACVGHSTPPLLRGWIDLVPLSIRAQRWQRRQMCLMHRSGFPRTSAKGSSRIAGFSTGDMVKAIVPSGKPVGTHVGKIAVKAGTRGTVAGVPDIAYRYCRRLQLADGYAYMNGEKGERAFCLLP